MRDDQHSVLIGWSPQTAGYGPKAKQRAQVTSSNPDVGSRVFSTKRGYPIRSVPRSKPFETPHRAGQWCCVKIDHLQSDSDSHHARPCTIAPALKRSMYCTIGNLHMSHLLQQKIRRESTNSRRKLAAGHHLPTSKGRIWRAQNGHALPSSVAGATIIRIRR